MYYNNQYYYRGNNSRGLLLPFLGGIIIGGLVSPYFNQNNNFIPYYPQGSYYNPYPYQY